MSGSRSTRKILLLAVLSLAALVLLASFVFQQRRADDKFAWQTAHARALIAECKAILSGLDVADAALISWAATNRRQYAAKFQHCAGDIRSHLMTLQLLSSIDLTERQKANRISDLVSGQLEIATKRIRMAQNEGTTKRDKELARTEFESTQLDTAAALGEFVEYENRVKQSLSEAEEKARTTPTGWYSRMQSGSESLDYAAVSRWEDACTAGDEAYRAGDSALAKRQYEVASQIANSQKLGKRRAQIVASRLEWLVRVGTTNDGNHENLSSERLNGLQQLDRLMEEARYSEAVPILEKLINESSPYGLARRLKLARYLCDSYNHLEKYENTVALASSIAHDRSAQRATTDFNCVMKALTKALGRLSRWEESLKESDLWISVIREDPLHKTRDILHAMRAKALAQDKLGRYREAETTIQTALEYVDGGSQSDHAELFYALALVQEHLGRPEAAMECLREAQKSSVEIDDEKLILSIRKAIQRLGRTAKTSS